jgi:hypothetical protein
MFLLPSESASAANENSQNQIDAFLKDLFDSRTQLLINQRSDTISSFYNLTKDSSNKAYQNELKRSMYINTWANIRGILLLGARGRIDIVDMETKGNLAEVLLNHSINLLYVYDKKLFPIESLGLGTRHNILLKKESNTWIVVREIYSDPINDNPELIPKGSVEPITPVFTYRLNKTFQSKSNKIYNRIKAISYANKYAGTAWGAGNNNTYNPKYKDYSTLGGDCTNFVSQVLGDLREAGGLPMKPDWNFTKKGVTKSWVNTDSFRKFLTSSGYGNVVGYGFFKEIVKPTEEHPHGMIHELQPGDLIGYEDKGDIVHFSIIIGSDSQGYLLVNSHTADRYHVPWDLGWDENTKFWLFHINY